MGLLIFKKLVVHAVCGKSMDETPMFAIMTKSHIFVHKKKFTINVVKLVEKTK
jgi:hypothetical protein